MVDRLLASTMNAIVLSLITLTSGGSLFLGYWGLHELFNGQAVPGSSALFASLAPALAASKLLRYRTDLVGP